MPKQPDNIKIAFVGGDERQVYCAKYLADKGFECAMCGFDCYSGDFGLCTKCVNFCDSLEMSDVIVLPLPLSRNGVSIYSPFSENEILLNDVCECTNENVIVLGGNADEESQGLFKQSGVRYIDYYEREELQVANAFLTAESAISIAVNELKYSMRDSSVLVIGYGRIGKALCYILKAMGVEVYASARKHKDFEWIRSFGYSPIETSNICDVVTNCGVIFNTVPKLVLGDDVLKCISDKSLIIDLASKPGGVDFDSAKKHGIKTIWALALPGKHLPKSAGEAIAKTIINILEDEEVIS